MCAFAGIGRPEAFRRSLTDMGAEIVSFRAFPDHHPFRRSELDTLLRLAAEKNAERIVTTEKDGVRLTDFPDFLRKSSFCGSGWRLRPPMHLPRCFFPGLCTSRKSAGEEPRIRGHVRF